MVFKNYYKLLGLEKNILSTQKEIKNAYRLQAKKYHPDVNVNNKAAEERFKDINEAYMTLSDEMKKRKYDKMWYSYVGRQMKREQNGKSKTTADDIINIFFGTSFNKSKNEKNDSDAPKGENIETQIDLTIKEAFEGITKKIAINDEYSENPQKSKKSKIINLTIPKGTKKNDVLKVEGCGKCGKNGGKPGDLLIKINIKDDEKYKLVNNDIHVNANIWPWDAVLGTKINVENIDGNVTLLIPKGTQTGNTISIKGKGFYKNADDLSRGDLIINVTVATPKTISEEEKNLFMQLKNISRTNPNANKI